MFRKFGEGADAFIRRVRGHAKKEKASKITTCLDLKPPYSVEIAVKPYPSGYSISKFQKFMDGYVLREYVVHFLKSMAPFAHDADLCLWEFSKSLTNRAYTWYVTSSQDRSMTTNT